MERQPAGKRHSAANAVWWIYVKPVSHQEKFPDGLTPSLDLSIMIWLTGNSPFHNWIYMKHLNKTMVHLDDGGRG